jgi:hypothetical protein
VLGQFCKVTFFFCFIKLLLDFFFGGGWWHQTCVSFSISPVAWCQVQCSWVGGTCSNCWGGPSSAWWFIHHLLVELLPLPLENWTSPAEEWGGGPFTLPADKYFPPDIGHWNKNQFKEVTRNGIVLCSEQQILPYLIWKYLLGVPQRTCMQIACILAQ